MPPRYIRAIVTGLREKLLKDMQAGRYQDAVIDQKLLLAFEKHQKNYNSLTQPKTYPVSALPPPLNPHLIPVLGEHPVNIPLPPNVAANEMASATGDPHIKGGDGGRFDFQGQAGKTYNLMNDTGLVVNAKFQSWKGHKDATTIGELGTVIRGPGGYSRIHIDPKNPSSVKVNGRLIRAGQSVQLADGGRLTVSPNGKEIAITTREGYTITAKVENDGGPYLDVFVKTPQHGVASDGVLPGGLLGHTFDADSQARNGKTGRGAQGEGAIDGHYTDYEIPQHTLGDPLFALPKPKIMKNLSSFAGGPVSPIYHQHFPTIHPNATYRDLSPTIFQKMWDDVEADASQKQVVANLYEQRQREGEQFRKMELLLMAALKSGNIDLAVVLMASVEANAANAISANILQRINKLQEQRKALSEKMGALEKDKKSGPGELYALNTQATDIGTEISLLQTFMQDAQASKRNAIEFSSNFLRMVHETARSIIQNIGR